MIYQPRIWASLELGWKAYITTRYTHLEIGLAQIQAGILCRLPSQIPGWCTMYHAKFRAGMTYYPKFRAGISCTIPNFRLVSRTPYMLKGSDWLACPCGNNGM